MIWPASIRVLAQGLINILINQPPIMKIFTQILRSSSSRFWLIFLVLMAYPLIQHVFLSKNIAGNLHSIFLNYLWQAGPHISISTVYFIFMKRSQSKILHQKLLMLNFFLAAFVILIHLVNLPYESRITWILYTPFIIFCLILTHIRSKLVARLNGIDKENTNNTM